MPRSWHQGKGGKDLASMLWESKDALFKIDCKGICIGHYCREAQLSNKLGCIHWKNQYESTLKVFKWMNNMEVQIKDLMKANKVLWLKREPQVEKNLEANDTKLETPTNLCVPEQQQASKQWTLKLQSEVVSCCSLLLWN